MKETDLLTYSFSASAAKATAAKSAAVMGTTPIMASGAAGRRGRRGTVSHVPAPEYGAVDHGRNPCAGLPIAPAIVGIANVVNHGPENQNQNSQTASHNMSDGVHDFFAPGIVGEKPVTEFGAFFHLKWPPFDFAVFIIAASAENAPYYTSE